jgi:hypothetical protein
MRCAHLQHRWTRDGEAVDRTGCGRFVEVYPAGALTRWGLSASGYKRSGVALGLLVRSLRDVLPTLELTPADTRRCTIDDDAFHAFDAFDAVVTALVARAGAVGLTDPPGPADRELAEEEGWIHLPVRGSLPFLARARDELRCDPRPALAGTLRDASVAVDAAGYAAKIEDNLLAFDATTVAAIRADLEGKGGGELIAKAQERPKLHAAHSSAALAANVFGPWLSRPRALPFGGVSFSGSVHLERECPTALRGAPPTLDVLVEGEGVLAIESKCTEPFAVHEAHFSDAYDAAVLDLADLTWRAEYARLREDPHRYRYLDAPNSSSTTWVCAASSASSA